MAFNPFHGFRKRQKTLLAAIAILCMFLFVLQFGRGDIFDKLGLGRGKSRENREVTKIYGDKVYEDSIRLIRQKQLLASQFMAKAAETGLLKLRQQADEFRKNPKPDTDTLTQMQILQEQQRRLYQTLVRYSFQTSPVYSQQQLMQFMQSIQFSVQFLAGFSPSTSDTQQAIAQAVPCSLPEEVLDFMIWRHQAERLGITLTPSSIQQAIKNLTADVVDLKQIEADTLRGIRDFETSPTHELLYEGLGEDLSVRMAREALIGSPAGSEFGPTSTLRETNALVTPEEFWSFFKKNRSSREIALLGVSEDSMLDQVKDQPTEKELEQFFDRFSQYEYAPTRNKPGFKEPRRIKLQWVSAKAAAPDYAAFADAFVLSSLAATPTNPLPAIALGLEMDRDYQNKVQSRKLPSYERAPYQLPTDFEFSDNMWVRTNEPANLAGLVGSAAQGPCAALLSYRCAPVAREVVNRSAIFTGWVGQAPNPWATVSLAAMEYDPPKKLPIEAVGGELVKDAKKKIAQGQVIANLTRLKNDMEEKRKKNENVAEWLKKSLGEYHVTTQKIMAKPLSRYEMNDDADLKPLKDIYIRFIENPLDPSRSDPKGEQFPLYLFTEEPKYVAKEWPNSSISGGFTAWNSEDEPFLYWKTDDEKAYVPKSLGEVRGKVEKAWKLREAQKLARKQAEELAQKVRKAEGDIKKLRDLALREKASFIELHAVSRIVSTPSIGAEIRNKYELFKFPDTVSFPADDFLNKLVDLEKPGDTIVDGNQPEKIFYVSTLLSKKEPSLQVFYDTYRTAKSAVGRDALFDAWAQEQRQKWRIDITNQLREEACPAFNNGFYQLDPEVRQRLLGRQQDTGE